MQYVDKEKTKKSYEETAQIFADNVAELAPLESIEKMMSFLPKQNPKIIDIGCGSGRDAGIFIKRGVEVVGIDYCSNLLNIAKANAPSAQFHLMDIEEIQFPPNSFNGAWASASLLHIPKKKFPNVLKNIHYILKDNGIFYLTLKKGEGEILEKDIRYAGHHEKFWSYFGEDELKNYLLNLFNIIEFVYVKPNQQYQTHLFYRVFCQKK